MRNAFCILSLACILPAAAQAQHPGAAVSAMSGAHFAASPAPILAPRVAVVHPMMAARPVAHTGRISTRMPVAPRNVHPVGWNHVAHGTTIPADPVFPIGNPVVDGYPVPGLGFDYPHYFATHPNAGRCHRCFDNGLVLPFVDGGIYIPMPMYADQSAEAQPAEEGAAPDQGQAQAAQTEEPTDQGNYGYPPARTSPQPAPKPQAEYVFVRRDGSLIFAVAYSWINDRLQYVTGEGIRRTVPLNTLDLDATQQFNDQRGVPIRLPA